MTCEISDIDWQFGGLDLFYLNLLGLNLQK